MWITKNVNLPESLIDAKRNERLVVFAGAGISVGPPSNLPNFEQLATQVGGGALAREESEPVDRFLGRLEKKGIQVHSRTCNIISDPNSKPTPLHHTILSLFHSPGTVHIVTTNFDRHFSTVAAELFQDGVEVYYPPALPLGREFNGLVYLHGSVDKGPESLVLTDSDFGRAYLTDGWATHFLYEMFTKYTVIFVGYSHGDPVMHYLARTLASETSRFALTEPGQDEHWKFLGITPVTYPLNDGPNRHSALGEALAAWVELAKMGALDHERRITEIVKSNPPLEKETADYIEGVLKNLVTVRFFTRHARTPEWLRWAESKQAFRKLFQTNEHVDEMAQEIANWFAQNYVCEYPEEALALVHRRGQKLNSVLQNAIAHRLAFGKPRPDARTLAKWVTFLLSSTLSDWQPRLLGYLLKNCRYPEDKVTALLLFEYLTRPHLKLKAHFRLPTEGRSDTEQVDADIVLQGEEHLLKRSWKLIFQPHLGDLSRQLEPIPTNHLMQAHFLLRAVGEANDRRDSVSFLRSAIEPHEQDRHGDKLDLLIDATRDIIEWMLEHDSDRAHAVIEAWSTSGVPLLKRLAIHGIAESSQMDPDEKIAWLLEKDWLYVSSVKHEIFRLLAKAYPNATEPSRVCLLERVDRGPVGQTAENLQGRTRKYKVYNLLVWLHGVAPDCSLATERFKAMQEAHPDFRPREHPDFDTWTTVGWGGPQSPLTVKELLSKNLKKRLTGCSHIRETSSWGQTVKEELVQDLWGRWMDNYWSQRITGIPLPLSQDEKDEMVLWTVPLEPVFPAAVKKICATSAPRLKQTHLYYELVEKKFAARHPMPLTHLLQHLLSNADEPFLHCREVEELVRSLVDSATPPRELLVVCEDLARLGCPNAGELKELAQESA